MCDDACLVCGSLAVCGVYLRMGGSGVVRKGQNASVFIDG